MFYYTAYRSISNNIFLLYIGKFRGESSELSADGSAEGTAAEMQGEHLAPRRAKYSFDMPLWYVKTNIELLLLSQKY